MDPIESKEESRACSTSTAGSKKPGVVTFPSSDKTATPEIEATATTAVYNAVDRRRNRLISTDSHTHTSNAVEHEARHSRKRPRGAEDWLVHPPDGSAPIDLRREAEAILGSFERSLCRDVVFELHRELHTGILTNERLWAEVLHPPPEPHPGGDIYGRVPPREPSTSITCPSCGRSVGAARYAPHLDKCALGSTRGRSSRSARSSPPRKEQFKPIENPGSASKSSSRSSSKSSSKSSAKASAKSSTKPSIKPPTPKSAARPASKPAPKPPSKPPATFKAPSTPKAAPLPPPPAVHAPITGTKREPLHILIKLVDGAPVQTYHRVVLQTPRAEKSQQLPRSPSSSSSSRKVDSDDCLKGPRDSQKCKVVSSVGDKSGGDRSLDAGLGDSDKAKPSFSSKPRSSSGGSSSSSSNSKNRTKGSSTHTSGVRLVDSRGSASSGLGNSDNSSSRSPSIAAAGQGGYFRSQRGASLRYGNGSPSSPPSQTRVPPPMFISASGSSPPATAAQ